MRRSLAWAVLAMRLSFPAGAAAMKSTPTAGLPLPKAAPSAPRRLALPLASQRTAAPAQPSAHDQLEATIQGLNPSVSAAPGVSPALLNQAFDHSGDFKDAVSAGNAGSSDSGSLPTPKDVIGFLRSRFPSGQWSSRIPGLKGGVKNKFAIVSTEHAAAGSINPDVYPEKFRIAVRYSTDPKNKWLRPNATFTLRDVPGNVITEFQFSPSRMVIETRKNDEERRHYGPYGARRERLTLTLSEGWVRSVVVESWDFIALPLFRTTRSAMMSTDSQPWIAP